jgi:membrane-associated phospholipid phosphatase
LFDALPVPEAPVARSEPVSSAPGQGREPAERLRAVTLWVLAASVGVAIAMAASLGFRMDAAEAAPELELMAAVLLASTMLRRRWRNTKIADCFGTQGILLLAGLACGFMSLAGLRLHFPKVDGSLLAFDHAMGLDGAAFAAWVSRWPHEAKLILLGAYKLTVATVFLSLIVQAVRGQRLEVWRAAFCFVGTLLTVCAVAVFTPAKGLGLWIADETLAHLPPESTRYFWPTFDRFYEGSDVMLRTTSIDGVVSFPSFHMIMGLIILTLWRAHPVTLVLSLVWFFPMLAATVPLGGHYFADLVGGFAIWALWFGLSRSLERGSLARPASPAQWRAEA